MRPRLLLCALALTPVTALAACGGDDETDASSTPAEVQACELLEDGEVAAKVGDGAAGAPRTGQTIDGFDLRQCEWKGANGTVTVAVVGSPERFEMHKQRGLGEPVDSIGDGGLVERGTSLESRGSTRGRTVFVLDGDRTLVVALDRGSADVAPDEVVALARSAHGRLP
jgi:hypothetical protein